MSAQIQEPAKRYLDPALFRQSTPADIERLANKLIPQIAPLLHVNGKAAQDNLRATIVRHVIPLTVEYIMELANENVRGELSEPSASNSKPGTLIPNPKYRDMFVSLEGRADADKHDALNVECPCSPWLFAVNDQYKQNLYNHREAT